jgi:hypothetical protein
MTSPIDSRGIDVLPELARGKILQRVHVSKDEGTLSIDLQLQDGLGIELTFSVSYRSNISLVKWENGDSRLLEQQSR